MLIGCNLETDSSNHEVKRYQVAPKPTPNYFPIEQSQTPNLSNTKLFGMNIVKTITPDSTPVPSIARTETNTFPSSETTGATSNGNVSDAALELIGQRARGTFILQKISLINQPDYTSCGEAAFAMGWNYRHPEWALDIGIVETIGLKLNVYFPALSQTPHGYLGTSPSGMEGIGNYYAIEHNQPAPTVGNIDLDMGGAYARLEAKGLLYSQLSTGNPVIIEVTDIIGNPNNIYNDSHYVIVTGMNFDIDIVIYNDPLVNLSMSGKFSGLGRSAEWSQIWASWSNNKDKNPGISGHPGRGWYMIVH